MEGLGLEDAKVYYYENFLDEEKAGEIFNNLSSLFEKETMKEIVDDRGNTKYKLNRKTMVFIDESVDNTVIPKIWGHDVNILLFPESLLMIKTRLEELLNFHFNICLANFYDNGKKSIGWHSDNEEKGSTNCIASLSIGAERAFQFRRTGEKYVYRSIMLNHGSLLVMAEGCQEHYQHSLPVDKTCTQSRLNLTFRIFDSNKYINF